MQELDIGLLVFVRLSGYVDGALLFSCFMHGYLEDYHFANGLNDDLRAGNENARFASIKFDETYLAFLYRKSNGSFL